MKHETINSIGVVIGLILAAPTAWNQYFPQSDNIQIIMDSHIDGGWPVRVDENAIPKIANLPYTATIGPVAWRVQVNNTLDRSISVVGYKIYLRDSRGAKVYYSGMKGILASRDTLQEVDLPLNLDARRTEAFLILANMPFLIGDGDSYECNKGSPTLGEVERCFYQSGRDLFGNPVDTISDWSQPPALSLVTWLSQSRDVTFGIEFETADGSKFAQEFSYFGFGTQSHL